MLLDDLLTYLQSAGIAEQIQLGSLQDTPDTAIVGLIETGGFASEHTYGGAVGVPVIDEPTVQVLTRAMDYEPASDLMTRVKFRLDGLRNEVINSVLYHWVMAMQPPFLLERDDSGRYVLAFNVHIKRQAI